MSDAEKKYIYYKDDNRYYNRTLDGEGNSRNAHMWAEGSFLNIVLDNGEMIRMWITDVSTCLKGNPSLSQNLEALEYRINQDIDSRIGPESLERQEIFTKVVDETSYGKWRVRLIDYTTDPWSDPKTYYFLTWKDYEDSEFYRNI